MNVTAKNTQTVCFRLTRNPICDLLNSQGHWSRYKKSLEYYLPGYGLQDVSDYGVY